MRRDKRRIRSKVVLQALESPVPPHGGKCLSLAKTGKTIFLILGISTLGRDCPLPEGQGHAQGHIAPFEMTSWKKCLVAKLFSRIKSREGHDISRLTELVKNCIMNMISKTDRSVLCLPE